MKIPILLVLMLIPGFAAANDMTASKILGDFAEDFQQDRFRNSAIDRFTVHVDNQAWIITRTEDGDWQVHDGQPSEPGFGYAMSIETLRRIHAGELGVLTAGGKASAADSAPLEFVFDDGFDPAPDVQQAILPFTFHFFTRGEPEIVPFGKDHSRIVHGANASILFYQPGLRSAWYGIDPGQHINRDQQDQINPFPTLAIFIAGHARARIDGKTTTLKAGQMAHIPAGVAHEFWNDGDKPAEFIIVMFGEGA